jgi:hypothetical protein
LEAVAWRRGRHLSQWASGIVERAEVADRYELEPSLMAGLSGKDDPAELVLVAKIPVRRLSDTPVGPDTVACVLDRIASPGNLGSVVRSADALGAGVVVTVGHGADPYDPVCVRASTGSLFVVPVVSTSSIEEVVSWCAVGDGVQLVGADEQGPRWLSSWAARAAACRAPPATRAPGPSPSRWPGAPPPLSTWPWRPASSCISSVADVRAFRHWPGCATVGP